MYRGGGGGSIEIFEINLLRIWGVDTESKMSPKYAAYAPPCFGFCLQEGKGVVCQMHGWF